MKKRRPGCLKLAGLALLAGSQIALGAPAKSGSGQMTVVPAIVKVGDSTNFTFRFICKRGTYNPGSQATLLVPAGWPAPQTNSASSSGFISVTPVLNDSTASIASISGGGPWTIAINFSTARKNGGFELRYEPVLVPTNGGVYTFIAQTRQSGGTLTTLKTGSPFVTVNSLIKTNTTTLLSASTNPSVYGQWVTFTALVTPAGTGTVSGTVTFRDGSVVLGTTTLDGSGQASISKNRFSVEFTPSSITAEYSGNEYFNSSVSDSLLQTVTAATLTVTGLAAGNKVYDGGIATSLDESSATLTGVIGGDDVSLVTTGATAVFPDANVGSGKTVTVSGLTLGGLDAANYLLLPPSTTVADITACSLIVTANAASRVYGAPNPTFTATFSGFAAGDGPEVVSGTPGFSTPADATSTVAGSPYAIHVIIGTLAATNYSFAFMDGPLTISPASTANAVACSANPSPTGSNVTLSAVVTAIAPGSGTPAGLVQFLVANQPLGSPVPLTGGIASLGTSLLAHGYHVVTATYEGDGNFLGSTNNLASSLLINTPPVAGPHTLGATRNTPTNVPAAQPLIGSTDADGDVLNLVAVSPTSTHGGTVILDSGIVTYTPPVDYVGEDSFTISIADVFGASSAGTVTVTVQALNQPHAITSLVKLADGTLKLDCAGAPGQTYLLQASTNLVAWSVIATNVADSNGLFTFIDAGGAVYRCRFYRTRTP